MPTPPRISVLLPVYNAAPFLEAGVRSVLAQTLGDFELLILDDGSSDASPAILSRLAASDSRIRLTSRGNRGLVASLNEMIAMARAPLLARMDADDLALPERFAQQCAFLDKHPNAVCVGGAIEFMDSSGHTLHTLSAVQSDVGVQREALAGRTPICHPASMLRTAAVRAIGGYRADTWPAEDLDLFLRLGEIGTLGNIPQTVLRYRLHEASISASRAEQQVERMREVCRQANQRRGTHVDFDDAAWLAHAQTPESRALRHLAIAQNPTARALLASSTSLQKAAC